MADDLYLSVRRFHRCPLKKIDGKHSCFDCPQIKTEEGYNMKKCYNMDDIIHIQIERDDHWMLSKKNESRIYFFMKDSMKDGQNCIKKVFVTSFAHHQPAVDLVDSFNKTIRERKKRIDKEKTHEAMLNDYYDGFIRRCPFCSASAGIRIEGDKFHVGCFNDTCRVEPRATGRDLLLAIAGWNRRAK